MTTDENQEFPTKESLGREFQRLLTAEENAAEGNRRRVLVLAPVAVLLLAIVASVLLLGPGGENNSLGPSSAEAALGELADKVDAGGAELTPAGDGLLFQRLYGTGGQINVGGRPEDFHVKPGTYTERISETWTRREGDTWVRIVGGSDASSTIKKLEGSSQGFALLDGLQFSYEEAISLPRDPDELYERLSAGTEDSLTVLSRFQGLLNRPLPADLQAALTESAAKIPGVSLVGDVTTPFGDTVTAVSYSTGPGLHRELLFDPASGAYRGSSAVLSNGARLYSSLIFDRSVVPELGNVPEGGVRNLPDGEQDREQAATTPPDPASADNASSEFVPPEVPEVSTAVPEKLKPFCDAAPCSFIRTERWEGAKSGNELDKMSTPASECPDQAAVYRAAGYTNLGGFIGPCPTAKQMENIRPYDPNELEDRLAGSAG